MSTQDNESVDGTALLCASLAESRAKTGESVSDEERALLARYFQQALATVALINQVRSGLVEVLGVGTDGEPIFIGTEAARGAARSDDDRPVMPTHGDDESVHATTLLWASLAESRLRSGGSVSEEERALLIDWFLQALGALLLVDSISARLIEVTDVRADGRPVFIRCEAGTNISPTTEFEVPRGPANSLRRVSPPDPSLMAWVSEPCTERGCDEWGVWVKDFAPPIPGCALAEYIGHGNRVLELDDDDSFENAVRARSWLRTIHESRTR